MLEFVTSQKGTRKLVVNGFMFTKHKIGGKGQEIWRCESRSCQFRMHTFNDDVVKELGDIITQLFMGRLRSRRCMQK